jgi:hypothetical protein
VASKAKAEPRRLKCRNKGCTPRRAIPRAASSPICQSRRHSGSDSIFKVVLGRQSAIITEEQARELGFQFGLDFGGAQ